MQISKNTARKEETSADIIEKMRQQKLREADPP